MREQNSESSLFDNPMDEIHSAYKEGGYSKLAEFLDKYNPNPYDKPIAEGKLQAHLTQHMIYESEDEKILEAEEHATYENQVHIRHAHSHKTLYKYVVLI